MSGETKEVVDATEQLVESGADLFTTIWDRLAAGDVGTWISFLVLASFVVLVVGLFRNAIMIGRRR